MHEYPHKGYYYRCTRDYMMHYSLGSIYKCPYTYYLDANMGDPRRWDDIVSFQGSFRMVGKKRKSLQVLQVHDYNN